MVDSMAGIYNVSPEGVNRILKAVGPKFRPLLTSPLHAYPMHPYPGPGGNRSIDLAERLDASVRNYYAAVDSRGNKDTRVRIEYMETVLKAGKKLRDLLLKDDHLPTKYANDQLIRDIGILLDLNVSKIGGLKKWLEDPSLAEPRSGKN
jgi:hypothetical protein